MSHVSSFVLTLAASLVFVGLDQRKALAFNRADLIFDGVAIDVSGDNRPAVRVPGNDVNLLVTDSVLSTNGLFSHAVDITGVNNLLRASGTTLWTRGDSSHGVNLQGEDNTSDLSRLVISTEGRFSSAINLIDNSTLAMRDSVIQTSGENAHGVYLFGQDASSRVTAQLENVTISAAGANAYGLNLNRSASVVLQDSAISTAGENGFGVWVPDADSEFISRDSTIETSADGAIGVFAQRGGSAHLDGGHVHTEGNLAYALNALNDAAISARNLSLQVGERSVGAYALNNSTIALSNVEVSSTGAAIGIAAYTASSIEVEDSRVQLNADNGRGLQANGGGTLNLRNSQVNTDGMGGIGLQSLASTGVTNHFDLQGSLLSAASGQAMHVQGGDARINLANSHISGETLLLIEARVGAGGAQIESQDVLINATGSTLSGDIRSEAINARLRLADNSSLLGSIQGLDHLALDRSTWEMTGSSRLGELAMADGRVRFAPGAFSVLSVDGDLTGSGTFQLNTDLASLQGDRIEVGGRIEGDHLLVIRDSGAEPDAPDGELIVVDGNGGSGRFSLLGDHVDAGAFRYTLDERGDDWYLAMSSRLEKGDSGSIKPADLSSGANAAVATHTASASLWSAQMNALVKRLGDLRMGKDEGGVWSRAISKRFDFSENSSRSYSQNITGLQVGADKALPVNGGKVYVGGMVGTARADLRFGEGGSGNTDSNIMGLYATYVRDDGWYIDSVLKYSHMDNEIKTRSNVGDTVKGTYKTNGVGGDVEVGKRFDLANAWFVEPQLELTATRTSSARYTASNGLRVESDAMDSLQSRAGALFGRSLVFDNGISTLPYVKASYVTEHAGTSRVRVNDNKLEAKLPGSRVELGFGGVVQLTERSKISLDAEYAKGKSVEQPWGVNVGYRYLW